MVSSSKILTVSYGTFSCTAEGFEDPLGVMKETTHFFRRMVSEDRFFGAEPPQFDPEIAAEMMAEQLEQSGHKGKISLGAPTSLAQTATAASAGAMAAALTAGPARAAAAPSALPDDAILESAARAAEEEAAALAAAETDAATTDADNSKQDQAQESGPEPLVLHETDAVDAPAAPLDLDADALPDTWDDAEEALADDVDGPEYEDMAAAVASHDDVMDDHSLNSDDLDLGTLVSEGVAVEDAPAPRPAAPLAVADKLARIRAVVADNAEDPDLDDAQDAVADAVSDIADDIDLTVEDDIADHADLGEEVDEQALSALLGELDADLDDDEEDDLETGDILEVASDKVGDTLGDLDVSDLDDDDDDSDIDDESMFADTIASLLQADTDLPVSETADLDDDSKAVTDELMSDLYDDEDDIKEDDELGYEITGDPVPASALWAADLQDEQELVPTSDTSLDAADADALLEHADALADEADLDDQIDDDLSDVAHAPEPIAPVVASRARVVKVKRAVFDKAVEEGRLEQIEDPAPAAVPLASDSTLSPEEEDELARELAAVKAELAGDLDWDDDEDEDDNTLANVAAAIPADQPDPISELADAFEDDVIDDSTLILEQDDDDDLDEEDLVVKNAARAAMDALDAPDWDDEDDDDAPLRLETPVSSAPRPWETDIDALADRTSAELDDTAEGDDTAVDEVVRDSARKAVKMASPARALLTEQSVEDGDTSRLLDQTQSEMDEPEGNRRRSAIAHLRAAVAATKADRLLGRKPREEEELEAYREDLADVVRPRRPQAGSGATERPAEPVERPAPLKLVAEQRIGELDDEDDQAPAPAVETAKVSLPKVTPVRPRRVRRSSTGGALSSRETAPLQHAPADMPEHEGGFAAYAEDVGASDLPELLEAAAAYMSYVQGREQFSRPQLMTTVRQAELNESSREERLRSFGQLLRDGKIEKTSGGRFTASERISFKPSRVAS